MHQPSHLRPWSHGRERFGPDMIDWWPEAPHTETSYPCKFLKKLIEALDNIGTVVHGITLFRDPCRFSVFKILENAWRNFFSHTCSLVVQHI